MFERLTAENVNPLAIPVEIRMADGVVAKGKVIAAGGTRSLAEVLNSTSQFLEFEPYGGDSAFISKSRIAEIKPLGVPKGTIGSRIVRARKQLRAILAARSGGAP